MPPPSSTEAVERNPGSLSGFMFWSMIAASLFFIIGFSSVGWEYDSQKTADAWIGLWSTCSSVTYDYNSSSWFKATKGMMTIALILLIASLVFIFMYMFFSSQNKDFQLKMFFALNSAAVVFMIIGFVVFGTNHLLQLNWSFAFCVIGACVCTVAGILAFVQLMM